MSRVPVIIIIGGGGHARVLIDALKLCSTPIHGCTDADRGVASAAPEGVPFLGDDAAILSHATSNIRLVNGIGSVGRPDRRRLIFEKFKKLGYVFESVLHPAAVVAGDVVLGEGVQVMAGAVVQTGTRIGDNVIVNTRASVDHDCVVGDHAHIAPGVTLSGGVTVCDGVHIGTGAAVIQAIRIGADCLIGAGSVITKNLPPCSKITDSTGRRSHVGRAPR